jgi:GDPmannose 4,6-dehydratase
MPKVASITALTAQNGSYLAEPLPQKAYEAHGLERRSSSFNTARIDHLYLDAQETRSEFHAHFRDLVDAPGLTQPDKEVQSEEIYNFAAQSHVQVGFETPAYTARADPTKRREKLGRVQGTSLRRTGS